MFQSSSSPRRVAVPVLVKDGKPCGSGGGGGGNEGSRGGPSAALASPAPHMTTASSPHGPHHAAAVSHHSVVGVSHVMSSSQSLQHCSYSRTAAQQSMQQQQQPQCGAYLPLQARAWQCAPSAAGAAAYANPSVAGPWALAADPTAWYAIPEDSP